MTVASTPRVAGPFTGTGADAALPFAFKVFEAADLLVQRTVGVAAPVELTLDSDFTVSLNADQDENPGGSVTILAAANTLASTVYVTSQVATKQEAALRSQGGYYPKTIEDQLDRIVIVQQQLRDQYQALADEIGVGLFGELRTELSSLAAGKNADLMGFSHAVPYGQNTVGKALNYEINVGNAPYNAPLNGTDSDRAAFLAAIAEAKARGGARVMWNGNAKIDGLLTVDFHDCTLEGVGDNSKMLISGDFGDVILATPPGGSPNLQGFAARNFEMYTTNDTTSGALIHLDRCNGFTIESMDLQEHFGGLHIDGSVHGYIDTDIRSDTWFPSLRTNSYLCKVTKGVGGQIPAEIHIDKIDWRGQTGNYRLHYAVLIQCADFIAFDQPHIGFAKVGLAMNPGTDTDPILSIVTRGAYFDTCSENLVQALRPSSSYSADWGLHSIDCSTQYNSGEDGWLWFCESTGNNFWSKVQLGNMLQLGKAGVNVGKGKRIHFLPGWSIYAPSNNTAAQPGILLNNDVSRIRVGKGTVEKGSSPNAPNAAFQATSSVDKFSVDVINYEGCTTGIADSSVTASKTVASAVNW